MMGQIIMKSSRLLIEKTSLYSKYAVINKGKLEFIRIQSKDNTPKIDEIYCGIVLKYNPIMKAAIIDIGQYEVFLPSSEPLREGTSIIVQITREPEKEKRAKASKDITLGGNYVVLIQGDQRVIISKKRINDKDSILLKEKIELNHQDNFGILIRSKAKLEDFQKIQLEINKLKTIIDSFDQTVAGLLYNPFDENQLIEQLVYEFDLQEVITNHRDTYDLLRKNKEFSNKSFLLEPIFLFNRNYVNLERMLNQTFDFEEFSLSINHLEALCVVDVNSSYQKQDMLQEKKILQINKLAYLKILKILNLFGIGGIIVVDFVSMKRNTLKQMDDFIHEHTKKLSGNSKTSTFQLTSGGYLQMIREKNQQNIITALSKPCNYCNGSGHLLKDDLILDDFELSLQAKLMDEITSFLDIIVPRHYDDEMINKISTIASSYKIHYNISRSIDTEKINIR